MTLKVLSGVLSLSNFNEGNVTVNFTRHEVTGDHRRGVSRTQTLGPNGPFKGTPCYIAVPREFKVIEAADFKDHPKNENHGIFDRIDDPTETELFEVNSSITEDGLSISWNVRSSGDPRRPTRSEIRELSYMVVGDA